MRDYSRESRKSTLSQPAKCMRNDRAVFFALRKGAQQGYELNEKRKPTVRESRRHPSSIESQPSIATN